MIYLKIYFLIGFIIAMINDIWVVAGLMNNGPFRNKSTISKIEVRIILSLAIIIFWPYFVLTEIYSVRRAKKEGKIK